MPCGITPNAVPKRPPVFGRTIKLPHIIHLSAKDLGPQADLRDVFTSNSINSGL